MVVGIDGLNFASEFVVFKLSYPSLEASEVIVFGDGFNLAKGVVFGVGDDVFGILDVGTTIEQIVGGLMIKLDEDRSCHHVKKYRPRPVI
jgi:hypothetical protein